MGRPTHPALDRSRVTELCAFDEQILSAVIFFTAEDAGNSYKKDKFLCELSDLRGEIKETKTVKIAGFDEAGRGALAGPAVVGCVHFPPVLLTGKGAQNAESSYRGKTLSDLGGLRGDTEGITGLRCGPILDALAELDDSKRLSPRKRERLFARIRGLARWGIGCASPSEIDRLGIVRALTLAARRAYCAMGRSAHLFLLDRGLSLRDRHPLKALTAENAENSHKKRGFLCELGDLRGEKEPEIAITKGDARSLHIAAASILSKVARDRMMARLAVRFPDYDLDRNKGYGTAKHLSALQRLGPSPIHRRSFRVR